MLGWGVIGLCFIEISSWIVDFILSRYIAKKKWGI